MEFLGFRLNVYIYGVFLAITCLFLVVYLLDRTRLFNGILFILWIIALLFMGLYTIFQWNNTLLNSVVYVIAVVVGISLVVIVLCMPFFLTIGLLMNAWVVYRKEKSLHLANMLTLIVGLLFSVLYIVGWVTRHTDIPLVLKIVMDYITLIQLYISLYFINYAATAILYRFYIPRYNKDYLIVLGSGLIDGYIVSPLLASRIDKGIKFYQKAVKKGYSPLFIFSGGQGSDECLPEAEAMKAYALTKGVPEKAILVEDKSTTTYENLLFSKQMMTKKHPKVLIFTNNYHVFRAAIFARKVKLKAQGVGSKTALYFLPNAIIREFIAIMHLQKKRHLVLLSLLTVIYIVFTLISYFIA